MLETDKAREYFKPLTYEVLTNKSFNNLVAILEEHLGKWNRKVLEDRNKSVHDNRYYMTIHYHKPFSKYPGTRFIDKKYKEAFIIVKCDNYSYREGISFNKDGWIGFAGWSDNDNVKPFINAFKEWVDGLKRRELMIDLTIKKEIECWTPEQYEKLKTAKSPEKCQGIRIMKVLEKEQRDVFFNTYFVDSFPENPVPGRLINKDGIEYTWYGDNWLQVESI
jgi:hypothetical protein